MSTKQAAARSRVIEDILYRKGKKGLMVQNFARIIILFIYLPLTAILAQSPFERLFSALVLVVTLLVSILFLVLIRKEWNLKIIGVVGALIDVMLVCALSIVWYLTVGGTAVPASYLLKNAVTLNAIIFIAINSMALRPHYPAIVALGMAALHCVFYIYAANSPGIEYASNYYEAFMSPKLSINVLLTQVMIILATGGFFSWLNYNANQTVISAAALERTNNQLGRFFSPNVARTIAAGDDDFTTIGGTVQNVAVLFTDIRNFTSISEKLPPREVLSFLAEYHEFMVAIIFRHGGTLDKFIGDAIMATFGTPTTAPDDPLRAVRAAVEMEQALADFNERRTALGQFPIRHGIGIHYGPALVGNIGTSERLEYTVLGDTVNTASRIESSCKQVGISLLFSRAVVEKLDGGIPVKRVAKINVKGKTGALDLFTVREWKDSDENHGV